MKHRRTVRRPRGKRRCAAAPLGGVWLALIVALAAVTGCGDGLPQRRPVAGQVTYNGEPLTTGSVQFYPDELAEGMPRRPATGELDAEGRYELTTFRPGDGVIPGRYRVAVLSYIEPLTPVDTDIPAEPEWLIPKHYGSPAQSGLAAEVPSGDGVVEIDFALRSE